MSDHDPRDVEPLVLDHSTEEAKRFTADGAVVALRVALRQVANGDSMGHHAAAVLGEGLEVLAAALGEARRERDLALQNALHPHPGCGCSVLSNVSINGERLTWQALLEYREQELTRLRRLAGILGDLDRCEHGRHHGDVCTLVGGCGGPSHGNPIAREGIIGYDISGRPIEVRSWMAPPEDL